MSAHYYHEIYLHLTWHTKDSYPLITPNIELKLPGRLLQWPKPDQYTAVIHQLELVGKERQRHQ
jgi:hypothetical protein